jgi:hypothetical protein
MKHPHLICPKCGYTGAKKDFKGFRSSQCKGCGKEFFKNRADQKYCSVNCRVKAWSSRKGKKYFAKKQAEHRMRVKIYREIAEAKQ